MRILSIVAHPRPTSFCQAISLRARTALDAIGAQVLHHDLYAEHFDPCLTAEEAYSIGDTLEQALAQSADPLVRQHRRDLASADGLLIVHPNWWGKPPAILAGWLDRVLVPGVAYRLAAANGVPEGLLSMETALIFNTSDTPATRQTADIGDPLELIWGKSVLPFCGVKAYERHVFRPVVGSTDAVRAGWLSQAETTTRRVFSGARG